MRNKTVFGIILLFLIQAFSASLVMMPTQSEIELFFNESSDTSAQNNSSEGNDTSDNTTHGNNTDGNDTGGNDTTECIPWNNVECDDEFGCRTGERFPVLAIDENTGEVMLDSDGNQIEVWDCPEASSEGSEEEANQVPSIGILGTCAAICVGFAVITREQNE